MKKCFFSPSFTIIRIVNLVGGILCGGAVIIPGILLWDKEPGINDACCLLIASGICIIVYFTLFVVYLSRDYELCEKGITIRYANRFCEFYPWSEFEQVGICVTHRASSGNPPMQDEVIWCASGSVNRLPYKESTKRSSYEYSFLHCRSLLLIEFSQERFEEFKAFYKKDIPDYR